MNTYFWLCAALCLGIFALALFGSSLAANLAAGLLRRFRFGNRGCSPALLFLLRTLPFTFSLFLTVGLALPAFLLLEPRQTRESPEPFLIASAVLSVATLGVIAGRAVRHVRTSQRVLQSWLAGAERIEIGLPLPVFRVKSSPSLFAVAGILNPKVLIGHEALKCLSREELYAAIAHELAHVRFFDNLKRLVLSATRFPQFLSHLRSLDAAWCEAVELAADEEALNRQVSALDLGSAIVKIGRLRPCAIPSVPVCHLVSSEPSSTMALRLEHLCQMMDQPDSMQPSGSRSIQCVFLILMLSYLLILPFALEFTHRVMESLVK